MTYVNQGDTLADGLTPSPNKRLWVIAGSDNEPVYTSELTALGQQIVLNTIAYATAGAAVPKLEGTLTPWNTGVPAANLTGIKYSVRTDLQTSDNQVLSGTTTTNASGQFTIEDAALSALTTYYVTFENAGGTVFATHKLTTE
jgi:hypothetical protein